MNDQHPIFSTRLIKWYRKNARTLPWRKTKDPYRIWLSEIILQQTRVNQGLAYYLKFIENYPTVKDLANASEKEVLKDWQGLGYYSRARNLHQAAKTIVNEMDGQFPSNFKDIKKLKGVGDYTAAAIASFAYDLPHAVVDGNVYRLLSRIFGIETPIDSTEGKKEFAKIANQLIDIEHPADFNQAVMEFGALQCVPKNPDCRKCPFENDCVALKTDTINKLPVKSKKTKQRKRYFNYLILEKDGSFLFNHRDQKGIWQNLYDFPMVETNQEVPFELLRELRDFASIMMDTEYSIEGESNLRKHVLSHQVLLAKFYHIKVKSYPSKLTENFEKVDRKKMRSLPIPKLIENYLNEETNLLSLFN